MSGSYNTEQKQMTMECISQALFQLMHRHDYEKISVSAITELAGVSRMAFYRNYQSKDDIVRQYLAGLLREFRKCISDLPDPSRYDVVTTYFQIMYKNRDVLKLLLSTGKELFLHEQIYEHLKEILPDIHGYTLHNIGSSYLIASVCGVLYGTTLEWIRGGCVETPSEMAKIFAAFTRRGNSQGSDVRRSVQQNDGSKACMITFFT